MVIYVPRIFGGVLIIRRPITVTTQLVQRDGTSTLATRDGLGQLQERDGSGTLVVRS